MNSTYSATAAEVSGLHHPAAATSPYHAFPVLALLGIILGAGAADLLIPEIGYRDHGALFAAGMASAAGLLFGVVAAAIRSPASLFRTEHVLMIGLVLWVVLDAILGGYALPQVSRDSVRLAFFSVALFAVFLWLGSLVAARHIAIHPSGGPRGDLGVPFLFWAAVLCFLLGMLRQFLGCNFSPQCLYNSLFAPRFATPWHEFNYLGYWTIVVAHVRYLGFLTLPLAVALAVVERRPSWRVILTFTLGLIFVLFLANEGGRRNVGAVILAAAMVWLLLRPRLQHRHLLALAVVAAAILLVMQAMLAWRSIGIGTGIATGAELTHKGRSGLMIDKNLHMLTGLIEHVPSREPHTGMSGVIHIVSRSVPRSIWPDKPGRGIDLPQALGMRMGPGFSWTMSAVGDLFLIGGLWVVALGGFLYGMAANLANRLLYGPPSLRRVLVYSIVTMTLFVSLRTVQELVVIGFALFGLWGILAIRRWL